MSLTKFFCIVSVLVSAVPLMAQPASVKRLYWLDGNLGIGLLGRGNTDLYGALGLDAGFTLNEHGLISMRFSRIVRLDSDSPTERPADYRSDLALMYGYLSRQELSYFSLSIGIAAAFGRFSFERPLEQFTRIGIPAELRLFVTPASFLAMGVVGFANINSRKPFGGVMLGFSVGRFQ